jgi:hypothetical protein
MNALAALISGWTDKRGNKWRRGCGSKPEGGWLMCETVPGTLCWERGRWACFRLPAQTEPCATFDHLHEAADFMAESRA